MTQSQMFIEALKHEDVATLGQVSKTDVHNHGFYGTRRGNIEKWAGRSIPAPPETFNTLEEMNGYVNEAFIPYIVSQKGFEFILLSALQDAIEDGVKLLEMSVDSYALGFYPLGVEGMVSYLHTLQSNYNDVITFLPELGISRDHPLPELLPTVQACIESGVFRSLDLYGNEHAQPPETYKQVYADAQQAGMKLKAHVGEFGSAEYIRQTVEILELTEVQHGINAVESEEVMRWLAQNVIQLNICPTSNVVLSRVAQMQDHPIRLLYDQGIPVTINTDDLVIFDQSVSDEYLNLFKAGVLSGRELDDIRQRALEKM